MEAVSALTTLSSIVTSTVKIAEKGFEVHAVDEQAKSVLETVNQVYARLADAKTLRRQKSHLFTSFEKRVWDDTFRHTEESVSQVAALAERVRVDMQVSKGKVRLNTRMLFVLRDSPNIHVSLTKLTMANHNLTAAMSDMINRRHSAPSIHSHQNGSIGTQDMPQFPPTYEGIQFLSDSRRKNLKKRSSAITLERQSSTPSSQTELDPPRSCVHEDAGDDFPPTLERLDSLSLSPSQASVRSAKSWSSISDTFPTPSRESRWSYSSLGQISNSLSPTPPLNHSRSSDETSPTASGRPKIYLGDHGSYDQRSLIDLEPFTPPDNKNEAVDMHATKSTTGKLLIIKPVRSEKPLSRVIQGSTSSAADQSPQMETHEIDPAAQEEYLCFVEGDLPLELEGSLFPNEENILQKAQMTKVLAPEEMVAIPNDQLKALFLKATRNTIPLSGSREEGFVNCNREFTPCHLSAEARGRSRGKARSQLWLDSRYS